MASLRAKIVSGVFWSSIGTILENLTSFATIAFLDRLLEPKDFGLVAITAIAIEVVNNFSDIGFEAALIQREKDIKTAASTAFFIVIVLCLINYILLFLFAKQIAFFYADPIIEQILKILAAGLLITSFTRIHNFLMSKELQFSKKAVCEVVPNVVYGLTSIPLAFYGFGVWSIVYGEISKYASRAFLLLFISPWQPMFKFDLKIAWDLTSYGKHVMLNNLLKYGSENIDNALIGKFLGLTNLSFYKISYNGAALPMGILNKIIGRVSFPAFSKVQGDYNALKTLYYEILEYSSYIFVPAFLGLFLLADDFINLLYGSKWVSAIPLFKALVLFGFARTLRMFSDNLFLSTGKPSILTKITFLKIIIVLGLLFTILNLGLLPFCISISILECVLTFYQWFLMKRQYNMSVISNINSIKTACFFSFLMTIGILIISNYIIIYFNSYYILSILTKVLTGMVIYFSLIFFFKNKVIYKFANFKLS